MLFYGYHLSSKLYAFYCYRKFQSILTKKIVSPMKELQTFFVTGTVADLRRVAHLAASQRAMRL